MKEKIDLMDSTILEVVDHLPNDAILFVFGDHGMTDDGEHGGASHAETDSGLFIYSPTPLFHVSCPGHGDSPLSSHMNISNNSGNHDDCNMPSWDEATNTFQQRSVLSLRSSPRLVSQVDLVPTLSLLMGLPIPFSSIGTLIPELFISHDNFNSTTSIHDKNANQNYLLQNLFVNSIQVTFLLSFITVSYLSRTFYSIDLGICDHLL
jgi:phosphatidylinositol glycan class O